MPPLSARARYLNAVAAAGGGKEFPLSPEGAARGSLPPQYSGPYMYDPYSNSWINPQTGDPVAGELNPSGNWTPPGDLPSSPSEMLNQGGNMDLGGFSPQLATSGFGGYQPNAPDMSFGSQLPESPFSGPSPGIQLGPESNFTQPSWGELSGSLPDSPWANAQFPSYQAGMVSPSDSPQTGGQFDPGALIGQPSSQFADLSATVPQGTLPGPQGSGAELAGIYGPGGINSIGGLPGFSNPSADFSGGDMPALDRSGVMVGTEPGYSFDAQGNVVQTGGGGSTPQVGSFGQSPYDAGLHGTPGGTLALEMGPAGPNADVGATLGENVQAEHQAIMQGRDPYQAEGQAWTPPTWWKPWQMGGRSPRLL